MGSATHRHEWVEQHETTIIGTAYSIGWKCRVCDKIVSRSDITIAGLDGIDTGEHVLLGPGTCADGSKYLRQIIHTDGTLEIIRPKEVQHG